MSREGLERLVVWRKARDFALMVYQQIIPTLPPEEKWNLGQQLRRSAASIPANIAEGYGRFYYQETIRFGYLARGSLDETLSHVLLAFELGFIDGHLRKEVADKSNDLIKLINGSIAYLKRERSGENEPGKPALIHESTMVYITNQDLENGTGDPTPTLDSRYEFNGVMT